MVNLNMFFLYLNDYVASVTLKINPLLCPLWSGSQQFFLSSQSAQAPPWWPRPSGKPDFCTHPIFESVIFLPKLLSHTRLDVSISLLALAAPLSPLRLSTAPPCIMSHSSSAPGLSAHGRHWLLLAPAPHLVRARHLLLLFTLLL